MFQQVNTAIEEEVTSPSSDADFDDMPRLPREVTELSNWSQAAKLMKCLTQAQKKKIGAPAPNCTGTTCADCESRPLRVAAKPAAHAPRARHPSLPHVFYMHGCCLVGLVPEQRRIPWIARRSGYVFPWCFPAARCGQPAILLLGSPAGRASPWYFLRPPFRVDLLYISRLLAGLSSCATALA
jgi:hypothetical protein